MEEHYMSEPTTDPAVTTEQQGDPADLGDAGKKALKAERDARAAAERQNASLQAQLDEINRAKLSDLERAQATAQEFQQAAETAKAEALRWRIASEHGISAQDAETFLTGSDEAAIKRQAERLAQFAATPSAPRPDLTQSSTRDPAAAGTPQADFARFLNQQMG